MPFSLPFFSSASPLIIVLALSFAFLYTVYGAVYRLYLSPIAKFPGPRFAALTFWNEFWYDVVCGGRYTWKIAEYHERYGECEVDAELRILGRVVTMWAWLTFCPFSFLFVDSLVSLLDFFTFLKYFLA